jgi:DNA-binding PucR family transcriptional regulator
VPPPSSCTRSAVTPPTASTALPYADTLRAVLQLPADPSRAARSLHMHPSTLRHRMKRIRRLVQYDDQDALSRLALILQAESLR